MRIKMVLTYRLDNGIPKLEDIQDCIDKAKEYGCYIKLEWFVKYSGTYHVMVKYDDDAKEIYEQLPKVYGV